MEKLSEREEQMFLLICRMKEAPTLEDVRSEANRRYNREWTSQTISTFLTRAVKKGYLISERTGRYYYYYPAVTLEEYRKRELLKMKQDMFGDKWNAIKELIKELERSPNE